jgi:hypothetical protein
MAIARNADRALSQSVEFDELQIPPSPRPGVGNRVQNRDWSDVAVLLIANHDRPLPDDPFLDEAFADVGVVGDEVPHD